MAKKNGAKDPSIKMQHNCFVEEYVFLECSIEQCCELTELWEYVNINRKYHEENTLYKLAEQMKLKISQNVPMITWMRDLAYYAQKKLANHYMVAYYQAISKNNGHTYINTSEPIKMPRVLDQNK